MADTDPITLDPCMTDAPRSPLGHRLMFVLLSLLSFTLFAPTVLFPKLRQYGELLQEEALLKRRVAELNDEVLQRALLAEAFARDAIVNERLAVLDLGYRKPNEEVYAVPTEEIPLPAVESTAAAAPSARSALLLPGDWPSWTIRAEEWAQRHGLIDLYLDDSLRPVLLLMSGGFLIAAFTLFAPRVRRVNEHTISRGALRMRPLTPSAQHQASRV